MGALGHPIWRSVAAAEDLDIEVANLLSQRIAVDPEQIGSADLITAGRGQRRRQQRIFDFPQHPVIETSRGYAILKAGKIRGEMPLDRRAQALLDMRLFAARS